MRALHRQYVIIETIKRFLLWVCMGLSIGAFIWVIDEIVKAI